MSDTFEQLQAEYEAFRESSIQLEHELEAEIVRVDELWRCSEQKRRHTEEHSLKMKTELMGQERQRELANLREEKSSMMETIRNQEEALEQLTQSERRVKAEVEFLRRDLDESMETVAIAQTELEDCQKAYEGTNEKVRQELEELKAKLALVTAGEGEKAKISVGSPGRSINGTGEEELMRPLRPWPPSPVEDNDSILESTKCCGSSATDSTSVCSSRHTPESGRAYNLPIHGHLDRRPVSSETKASVVTAMTSAGLALTGGQEGEILRRSCEDTNDESSSSSDEMTECCFFLNFVPGSIRTLSQWRPFAWCEPR